MAKSTRYYSEDDPDIGVTPSALKRLGREKQLAYMRYWFHTYYEDPAQGTPHDSSEGGYLYIHGGPYDAHEALSDEFGHLVSEARIDEATEDVQSDGLYDWAPTHRHPNHEGEGDDYYGPDDEDDEVDFERFLGMLESGQKPRFGEKERLTRLSIIQQLETLEKLAATLLPQHGGIGHNYGPPDEEAARVGAEIREASQTIRAELQKPKPDAKNVAACALKLKSALKWIVSALASTVISIEATEHYQQLKDRLGEVTASLCTWLGSIMHTAEIVIPQVLI